MQTTIDDVRNFWNERPCNIRHSNKEIGTKEYFEEVQNRKYTVEPHIRKFADFENMSGKKVLEIGCGIGTDTINFALAGADVTAVDLSDRSVEICKKRFDVYGVSADIKVANAEMLSDYVKPDRYDLIYSFGVIHHTTNPSAVLEQIKLYADSDSRIRLMFYSKISWKGLEFFLLNGWKFGFNYKKTIKYFAEAQLNCPIAEVYSRRELMDLFKDFEVVKIEKDHIFPYRIEEYIKGNLVKRFIFRLMPKTFFSKLEKLLGWHYLIELRYTKNK